MSTIQTAEMWAAVEPVNRKYFGLGAKSVKQVFPKIFKVSQGTEAVRHAVEFGGTAQLALKNENATVQPLSVKQGTNKSWTYSIYAGSVTQSWELARDNRYKDLGKMMQTLGRSANMTPDYLAAQTLGRAFNTSFAATADGKPICSTTHLIVGTNSNDGSNMLSTAAALSETSLEDVYTALRTMTGADGMIVNLMPQKLVVPAALAHTAKKLSQAGKTLGSANNDPKVVGNDLDEVVVNPFLDAHTTTFWFVLTDWQEGGLFWEWDVKADSLSDQNIHQMNQTSMTFFRARHGCDDWRHVFGVNPT